MAETGSRLKTGVALAYSIGQVTVNAKDFLFLYFFLFFFNSVLGVSALLVGVVNVLALIADALSDPVMGAISDNYRSKKWGRRHFFMALAALPLGFGIWALFSPPALLGGLWLVVWMAFFAIFVRLALTVFFVPYVALNAELTPDYDQRTSLTTLRTIFGNGASVLIGAAVFLVFLADSPDFPDGRFNPQGYSRAALMSGIIAIVAVWVTVRGTWGEIPRLQTHSLTHGRKWWQGYGEFLRAFKSLPYRSLTIGFTFFSIMAGFATALSTYLLQYFWGFDQAQSQAVLLVLGIGIIPGAIYTGIMSRAYDKRATMLVSTALYVLIYTVPILARLMGWMPENGTPALFWSIIGIYLIGQTFAVSIVILSESMMSDVADEYALDTGEREEGILFAGISLARKLSFGLGGLLASILLFLVKFPVQTEAKDVDPSVLFNFGALFAPTIGVLLLGAFAFFAGYPVTRARHQETIKKLRLSQSRQTQEIKN